MSLKSRLFAAAFGAAVIVANLLATAYAAPAL